MASPGNSNQPPPFDMTNLFKQPSNPNPSNPNNPNPSSHSYFPQSSYPPPSGTFSYPPNNTTPFHHHQFHAYPQDQFINMHKQNPNSYPTPTLQQQQNHPPPHLQSPNLNDGARLMALISSHPQAQSNLEFPPPSMPTLSTVSSLPGTSEFSMPINPRMLVEMQPGPPGNLGSLQQTLIRLPSTKAPRGRHLIGDYVEYDVDIRLQGEFQPQLEFTPITKYTSDPTLVMGRQIAVSRTYICYGLKQGNIRAINKTTASRSLFKGHTQRVTDIAFFAEDVHFLASASMDGRIFIWKIIEEPDEQDKPQILGRVITAIQIVGMEEIVHPRVCWHTHKQEILVVGIGRRVLKVDLTKVGKGKLLSAEEPFNCHVDKLIDGVQLVGKHDAEVTDLSMCQWMTTRLVSASKDGTVKIWEDRKALPLLVLRPHDGQPVNLVAFLTSPHGPGHINLVTAGPLNRELKIWSSASEEGWLPSSDAESWQCTQTLLLKSSAEPRVEEAFFNQVVALPHAGLIVLANAKKNAIYAVHVDFGPNPAATRMDYIAEFTVAMPILSITGDSLPDGEHVTISCIQTHAIQQYALDMSQCLPPPLENNVLRKTGSNVSHASESPVLDGFSPLEPSHVSTPTEMPVGSVGIKPPIGISSSQNAPAARHPGISGAEVPSLHELAASTVEPERGALQPETSNVDNMQAVSPPLPLSPGMAGKLSIFRNSSNCSEHGISYNDCDVDPPVQDYSFDRRVDAGATKSSHALTSDENSRIDETSYVQTDIRMVPNPPIMFTQPTHLITPSEILSRVVSSSENIQVTEGIRTEVAEVQDVVVNYDSASVEVEVNVVGETGSNQCDAVDSQRDPIFQVADKKEKPFSSQVSDLSTAVARECRPTDISNMDDNRQVDNTITAEASDQPSKIAEEQTQDSQKDVAGKDDESSSVLTNLQPKSFTGGKKQKVKSSQISGPSSPSPSPFDPIDSSDASDSCSTEMVCSQILSMQDTLNQLMSMQQEMQNQMSVLVSGHITEEGKRIEEGLGQKMEEAFKANIDALWARFQKECAKREKIERDRQQQITSLISNCINKDLPSMLERTLKKELSILGQAVARLIAPSIEKTIFSSIAESFQRGVGDKAVNQLEKSVNTKLEATVARQIQAQFQTSGKQALQDALRSSLEALVIPAFEVSCKAMFEQVDGAFQKGLVEHTTAILKQLESSHSPLALALRDAINSASSITKSLTGELADGQRKLVALAAAGANSNVVNPLVTQLSNGPMSGLHEMVEAPKDPTKELSRLIADRKFEEAFNVALQRSDVSIVSWLCSQVDLQGIMSMVPLPLSQGVLLALLQQLACDISKEMSRKLTWMREVTVAINPSDPMIAVHVRPIFEQVYQILCHHRSLPTTTASEANSIRLLMHVINSMLMSCKC